MDAPAAHRTPPTRVEAVMADIAARIADRRLLGGARLPSIRACATAMGVSKTTVVDAYQRLAADGVVTPRRGSGFYVAETGPARRVMPVDPAPERAIDPYWITFQALEAGPETLKPGSGWLPDDWMPQQAIQRAIREIARASAFDRVAYDTPAGYAPLRELIARRLAERGVIAPVEQVLTLESGSQALDFICRFLVEPGDTVLVDDPCFFNFFALLAAHRAKIVGVPMTPDGPDLDAFAAALVAHRPRLYLTNCGFHNPTGATLAPASAHRILKLAEAHDLIIIEDDVFADFEHVPAPRLAAFDGLSRVVSIGGFTKTVSGAMRAGYIAARPDWVQSLLNLKVALSFGSGRIASAFVHRVMTDGSYRRHCESVRTKLAAATTLTLQRLAACGLTPWLQPRGGLFVWARLPDGCDANIIARRALARGIIMAPGGVFSTAPDAASFMRFNVARCAEPRIFDVLRAAMEGG